MNMETTIAIAKALQTLWKEGLLLAADNEIKEYIKYFIPAQPIPDIPNWREWCLKLQECGVKFEFDWGTEREPDWEVMECIFYKAKINAYRIPEQPVPEKIANYLNEEKTVSEKTSKPKAIKIQLPEIEVSGDVTDVKVCFYDRDRLLHNTAGLAILGLKVESDGLLGVGRGDTYFIHGTYCTEEDFERATQPAKELTVQEVEKLLGYKVKIVGKTE